MQRCPVCALEIPEFPRYPRLLRANCQTRACAQNIRPLEFFNLDFSGGLTGWYADTHETYPGVDSTVDGFPCRSEEGRFGGVVLQLSN